MPYSPTSKAFLRRCGARIAVRNDHLGQGGSVHDGPVAALVVVTKVMQGQPLARVEAHDQAPVLPAHLVTIDLEAGPLRLRNLQGFDVAALFSDPFGAIVDRSLGYRPIGAGGSITSRGRILLDPEHF